MFFTKKNYVIRVDTFWLTWEAKIKASDDSMAISMAQRYTKDDGFGIDFGNNTVKLYHENEDEPFAVLSCVIKYVDKPEEPKTVRVELDYPSPIGFMGGG